ncbi:MAG: CRP-like cAMP-activated global transcriptional regulator [Phycisphaerae bacterium]|nr:CRP-like cAMP-activated global transcriptional regulator [Phycisphaerae bacterium]
MDNEPDVVRVLRNCRLFASLDPAQIAALAEISRLDRATRGQRLFEQDTPCVGMYVVGAGKVKLAKVSPEGKEHILHMAEPGQTFAEAAVFGGFDFPVSAEVVEDAELAFMPKGPTLKLLVDHPQITLKLLAGMSQWLRRMVDLMESIVLRDAAGRVAKYIVSLRRGRETMVTLPLKHQELAAHLGLTRETISRTLGHLETLGLITQLPKSQIALKDPRGLEELAQS